MNETLEFPPIEEAGPIEIAAEVVDRADIKDGKPLVKYSRTELALSDLRTKYAGKTFDLTTTKGDKEARAARLELVTLRTGLERKRKELKAPALEIGKTIDAEAARITKEIEALEQPIDAQIKADEKRRAEEAARKAAGEAFRVALHKALIERIRGYVFAAQGLPSERIANGIAVVEGLAFGAETEEFCPQYESAQDETLASLRKLHADALASEAEAAERERQRIENERIAAENKRIADELERQRQDLAAQAAEIARQKAEQEAAELSRKVAQTHAIVFAFPDPEPEPTPEAQREPEPEPAQPVAPVARPALAPVATLAQPVQRAEPPAPVAQPVQEEATVRLGEICTRVGQGFTMTAAFVEQVLGIKPAAVDKAAKLYTPTDESRIYAALANHVNGLQMEKVAA